MQLAKAVASAAAALVLKAKNVAQKTEDSVLQTQVIAAATQCALSTSQLVACTKVRPVLMRRINPTLSTYWPCPGLRAQARASPCPWGCLEHALGVGEARWGPLG